MLWWRQAVAVGGRQPPGGLDKGLGGVGGGVDSDGYGDGGYPPGALRSARGARPAHDGGGGRASTGWDDSRAARHAAPGRRTPIRGGGDNRVAGASVGTGSGSEGG